MSDRRLLLIGGTSVIRALNEQIDRAARSDAKVLLTGESGTGKEVAARLIHERSPRRVFPLATINCAGIPDSLEVFRGAVPQVGCPHLHTIFAPQKDRRRCPPFAETGDGFHCPVRP